MKYKHLLLSILALVCLLNLIACTSGEEVRAVTKATKKTFPEIQIAPLPEQQFADEDNESSGDPGMESRNVGVIARKFTLDDLPDLGKVRLPLNYRFSTNEEDFSEAPKASPGSITTYHPGEDINHPTKPGDGDLGEPVYSIGNGRVAAIAKSWAGLLIAYKLPDNRIVYILYGHVKNIKTGLRPGDFVNAGDQIAEVGKVTADFAHLHLEIRKESHPNPTRPFFYKQLTDVDQNGDLYISNRANIAKGYENPIQFLRELNLNP